MCKCFSIIDPQEVCDTKCQESKPVTKITEEGMLRVTDPLTDTSNEVDPST